MKNLFVNIIEGATAGGLIGSALDGLFIVGSTVVFGPAGFVVASETVVSKAAAGTLIGGGAGVLKTIKETSKNN